jgi:type II restriction/modification system DNA methylase subunit YeeA
LPPSKRTIGKRWKLLVGFTSFTSPRKRRRSSPAWKKGQKIIPPNIPAATQLFTPHWIVRYLVENSLGRLWALNHPESKLLKKMDYYIAPLDLETEFLRISTPEEIKMCDPACGSGHMLTYAFDLLYEIYREAGYPANEIAPKVLLKNLFGIEIDQRAGALAAFALVMKAAGYDRRILKTPPSRTFAYWRA